MVNTVANTMVGISNLLLCLQLAHLHTRTPFPVSRKIAEESCTLVVLHVGSRSPACPAGQLVELDSIHYTHYTCQ